MKLVKTTQKGKVIKHAILVCFATASAVLSLCSLSFANTREETKCRVAVKVDDDASTSIYCRIASSQYLEAAENASTKNFRTHYTYRSAVYLYVTANADRILSIQMNDDLKYRGKSVEDLKSAESLFNDCKPNVDCIRESNNVHKLLADWESGK